MAGSQGKPHAPDPSSALKCTCNLTSEEFVESAGVILFDKSLDRVCILHHLDGDVWVLPKGRRNCGETRQVAALREAKEETGYSCRLLPVRMSTRAPPANEDDTSTPDEARLLNDLTEPFSLTLRELGGGGGLKLVWWFIAVVDEAEAPAAGEAMFQPCFLPCHEAVQKLTFPGDRETLEKAIEIIAQQ